MSDIDSLYFCSKDNNTCELKDSCRRYLEADGKPTATLYKFACNEQTGHILYIKCEKEKS